MTCESKAPTIHPNVRSITYTLMVATSSSSAGNSKGRLFVESAAFSAWKAARIGLLPTKRQCARSWTATLQLSFVARGKNRETVDRHARTKKMTLDACGMLRCDTVSTAADTPLSLRARSSGSPTEVLAARRLHW
jgi:hypothetical protein